jgi:Uma2 family endonuclease
MPNLAHQLMVDWLNTQLKKYVEAQGMPGRVLFAPLPIRLWTGKYREPDIVYLNPQQLSEPSGHPHGADFAVEVVSEGAENLHRDTEVEPQEYATAEIVEYWIVDLLRSEVEVLVLDGAAYRWHGMLSAGSRQYRFSPQAFRYR